MTISKQTVFGFIAGAVVLATAFLGYTFYKQIIMNNEQQVVLQQIVNMINASNEAAKNNASTAAPAAIQ